MGEKQTQPKPQDTEPEAAEFRTLLSRAFVPLGGENEPLATPEQYAHVWKIGRMFADSKLVPDDFKGDKATCAIIAAFALRHKADPLVFYQHMHVIHGRPGMDAQLAIALANTSGKLAGPITHEIARDKDGRIVSCVARAVIAATGEVIEGSAVTPAIVEAEGWAKPKGDRGAASKWTTMPEHMYRFRSSVFMLREYAPELLMGLSTTDELEDIGDSSEPVAPAATSLETVRKRIRARVEPAVTEPPAAAPPKPEPPAQPVRTPDPGILDDVPKDDARDNPATDPLADKPAAKPAEVAKPAAPAMSEREKLVAQLREVCAAKGKNVPPVDKMSDKAVQQYIKTLSK